MDIKEVVKEIIDNIGNVDNIISISHCMTRLRFVLNDESKVDVEKLKQTYGVLGVAFGAGQLQVVMGKNVMTAYNEILKNYSFNNLDVSDELYKKTTKPQNFKEIGLYALNFVSGSVSPVISGLVAGGMMKLILFVAIMMVPEWAEEQSYKILAFVADVPFYFMPIFVAYGASIKLRCSPVYPMFVACILLHPSFINLVNVGESIHLFNLPIMAVKYSSTMVPALLSTIMVSYLEKFFNKIIPGIMKTVLVGTCTVFAACVLTLFIIGPMGTYIGNYLVGFVIWLQTIIGPFALAFLTAILPFMVMTGTHTLLAPFLIETLNISGFDTFFRPALILHVIAEGGASIGLGLRTKNKELRSEAISLGIGSIFAGISEPVLYGICLRYKRPLIGVMAGGAVGGLIAGFAGVKAYTMSKTTVLALPIFKETMIYMMLACFACLLVAAIVSFILGIKEDLQKEKVDIDTSVNGNNNEDSIYAITNGEAILLEEVKDDVFSKKTLGDGIAFRTHDGKIVAPCSGILTTVFPGGHAYGITREDGIEVLIHIGIDTVTLNGRGFDVKVRQNDKVKQGEVLVNMNMDDMKTTNLDLTIMMVFTDVKKKRINKKAYGKVQAGKTVVAII